MEAQVPGGGDKEAELLLGHGGEDEGQIKGPCRAPFQLGMEGPEKPSFLPRVITLGAICAHECPGWRPNVECLGAGRFVTGLWEHYCLLPAHLDCLSLSLPT